MRCPLLALVLATIVTMACEQATPTPSPSPVASTVVSGAACGAGPTIDAEDLRVMALPKDELGSQYAGFKFDSYFAGFESNEERARDKSPDPAHARDALSRLGRLAAYQAMYVPPVPDRNAPVLRIFTVVDVFRDAAGAGAYLADSVSVSKRAYSATDFDAGGIGEQSAGVRGATTDELHQRLTRVLSRRGRILATVGINRSDDQDVRAEATVLARKLDDRVRRAVGGELCAYGGAVGSEIGPEHLQLMPLPQADFGGDYSAFGEDFYSGGFQDNEEWVENWSLDPDADRNEYERARRITAYIGAYSSEFATTRPVQGFVSSGAHLFHEKSGAESFLSGFAQAEKRLAGRTVGNTKIESVTEFTAAGIGEQSIGVVRVFTSSRRYAVLFRRGRVIGEIVLVRSDGADRQMEALAVARKLDQRMQSVLAGQLKP